MKKLEEIFEYLLWKSRLFVILAVISSIVGAILLLIVGTVLIFKLTKEFFFYIRYQTLFDEFMLTTVTYVISAVDIFLISTILFIFGFGIYELFVSKIDVAEKDEANPKLLIIKNLDQLKGKLGKVVIMVLIVSFFKLALKTQYSSPKDLLFLSGGILLISLAFFFISKTQEK